MTDDPGEITRYPVAELEDLAKSIIRQAAAREHRWLAWSAFQGAMKDARPDGREFPWEAAGKLTSITPDSAKDVMARMLMAVPDAAERDRLAKIGAREAEILETRLASGGPDPASSGLRCQVCSRTLPAGSRSTRKTCSNSCRQALLRTRRRRQDAS